LFLENWECLEECYVRFNHLCDRKGVSADIDFENKEEESQKKIFCELKGEKDVQKKSL
jgi:ribosomal protein S24E